MTFSKQQMQRLNEIYSAYRTFLDFENRKINLNAYLDFIKVYINHDPQICKTCSASIKRLHSEFQVKVLSDLYREFPTLTIQPDANKLTGSIYAGTAKTSLITASIEIHQTLINKFKSDYTNKKFNIDLDTFKTIHNEMISMLTLKIRYFVGDIYSSFIESSYPIKFVKLEAKESIAEPINYETVEGDIDTITPTLAEAKELDIETTDTVIKRKGRKKQKPI